MKKYVLLSLCLTSQISFASNQQISSFSKAKQELQKHVYNKHRKTLYCNASFDESKKVNFPHGFVSKKYKKRAKKIEWEHVVPAENFGRTFTEWRDGDSRCINRKGKSYKGRKCANKTNSEYRYMQADMFNLYPAIGSVNALRSNYNFTMLPAEKSSFGSCEMKINNRKAEPPAESRGRISRTYLYMEQAYSRYSMSDQQQKLMNAWDRMYPVSEWECERAKKISQLQGNQNNIVESRCKDKNFW